MKSDRLFDVLDRALRAVFWACLALVFLRPSALRFSTPLGRVSITSAKNIAVALGLFWLALALARPRRFFSPSPLLAPLAIFPAVALLSALVSPFGPAAERMAAVAEAACYGLFFCACLHLLRRPGAARAAAIALVAAAAVVAAVDLRHHARAGIKVMVDQGYPLWDGKNALGLFLAMALAVGVSLPSALRRRRGWAAAALAPILLLVFLCAVYSYSRAAWLAVAAAAVSLVLLRSWRWIGLIAAAGLVLALLPYNQRAVRRLFSTGHARDRTAVWRRVVWNDALRMVRARPVLGVGPGEFRRACHVYEDPDAPTRRLPRTKEGLRYRDHAHNLLLQVAAETGLAGLAVFLWGACAAGRAAIRFARAGPGLGAGVAAALAAFAAFSCVDSSWTGRFSGSSFLHINLIVALLAAMAMTGNPPAGEGPAPRPGDGGGAA